MSRMIILVPSKILVTNFEGEVVEVVISLKVTITQTGNFKKAFSACLEAKHHTVKYWTFGAGKY